MSKKKIYIIAALIFIAAIFLGILDYPDYFNRGVDYINNARFSVLDFQINLPHFLEKPFRLGLDLEGGTHLVYEADLSGIAQKDYSSSMQGLRDVIERRVNLFGVREPVVQTEEASGRYRLIVDLAGIGDPAQAIKEIGKTPFLEFREQKPKEEIDKILAKRAEIEGKTQEEAQKIENWQLALEDPFQPAILTGQYLKNAEPGFDQTTYQPLVLLQFNDDGAKLFGEITARNVGKPVAIYIDGILISAPVVQEPITGGKAQITGQFSANQVQELARNLNAGALPVPIKIISQQTIGPSLGKVSLEQSLIAGIVGFLGVILFMIIFYRFSGLLASLALIFYVILTLAVFKLMPVTLTLAGIAGFLLSIGMAVDANILIFARMREEFARGRDFTGALEEGFRRAWPSIRDSNFNSLIVCAILFGFATSFVKGFALTLGIGILASMLSAIFVTRTFLRIFVGTKLEKINWLW